MKSKFKILLLILTCFTLTGCFPLMGCRPRSYFTEYKYIGTELPHDRYAYTRIGFNKETDLYIRTGYYFDFIDKKENGLTTVIKANSNFDLCKNKIIKEVKSSILGKLKRIDSLPYTTSVYDTTNTIRYNLTFEKHHVKNNMRKIKKDTISIELTNGKKLLFVRSTE